MQPTPAILTPERIEAMLSGMAEVCFAGVNEAGARMPGAEDAEAFERTSRALQTTCRNLRQVIAMKLRFDREQAAAAATAALETRRLAEGDRQATERARRPLVARHRSRVTEHFERLLWTEYEADDAQEMFDDLDARLYDFARDDPDVFLQTPVEALIAQLSEDLGVGDFKPKRAPKSKPEPEPDPDPPPPRIAVEAPPPPAPPAKPWRKPPREPEPVFEAEPPPRPPDPQAPEPWPEPYIPPWEKLRTGQYFPGGSGW